jgi:CBS domain-containing protein
MSAPGQRSYVGPAFSDAKVHDAMHVGVITCPPETSLGDAARMMNSHGVHCLVVADVGHAGRERPWGVVDALDVALAEAQGSAAAVGEIAKARVITIDSNASLHEAARVMAERRVSHLVVVRPATNSPAGVISASGLAAVLAWGRS